MKIFTKEPYKITITCSMYLCSKSFLMCQWHKWPPNNFNWFSSCCATSSATGVSFLPGECGNAQFSVSSSWRVSILEDLSVHYGTEALHGLLCFIKANLPPLFMCPFSTRPSTPSGLRETLTFELLPCHLLLSENRERRREQWPTLLHLLQSQRSVHLSMHPSVRLGECAHTPSLPHSIYDHKWQWVRLC